MPLIMGLAGKGRQISCEFKASLVYTKFQTARAMQRNLGNKQADRQTDRYTHAHMHAQREQLKLMYFLSSGFACQISGSQS